MLIYTHPLTTCSNWIEIWKIDPPTVQWALPLTTDPPEMRTNANPNVIEAGKEKVKTQLSFVNFSSMLNATPTKIENNYDLFLTKVVMKRRLTDSLLPVLPDQ